MRQYLDLLRDILDNGEEHDDRTGVGTRSVFGRQIRFDLRQGFPLMTTKKIPLRWIFEELKWFLSGSTYEPDLRKKGVDIWKEWATEEKCAEFGRAEGDLGAVYGALWRHYNGNSWSTGRGSPERWSQGVDQIDELLKDITVTPNSRRLIVTGWNPETQRKVALPPCHTLFQFKVHPATLKNVSGADGMLPMTGPREISCHLYARSIDAFLGLPFNIASYALLLEMIALVTGLKPRELIISFGDVHIYKNHFEAVDLQLSRDPVRLPKLTIDEDYDKNQTPLEKLFGLVWEDVSLNDYTSYPSIKAPVAV